MTTDRDIRNQIQYAVDRKVAEAKEESFAEGHESGLAEGREEGIEETKLATAKKMLAMNYPIEDISKITGLSTEILKDLK